MPSVPTTSMVKLRPPRPALLVVLFLLFCVTPLAFVRTPFLLLYAIPLGVLLWICRAGTDIDADGVTVRAVAGRRHIAWSEIQALSPTDHGELRAVLRNGRLMRLPQARLRHLSLIAEASAGPISDINAVPETNAVPEVNAPKVNAPEVNAAAESTKEQPQ